jgi:hypothetical protein
MHVHMHVQQHAAHGRAGAGKIPVVPAYEYRRATWDEVPGLGQQGWRLVPVPPIVEMRQVLGQPQMSDPQYVMERERAERYDGTLAGIAAAPAGGGTAGP